MQGNVLRGNDLVEINFVRSLNDNYEIGQTIGKGFFGKVKKARRASDNKEFAIKEIDLTNISTQFLDAQIEPLYRILESARSISLIKNNPHQNVVSHFGAFVNDENYKWFEVIEYCNGGNIYDRSDWTVDEALDVCYQVAKGLSHLHNLGIIHRAIKNDDILIHQVNGKNIYKIADFDCACVQQTASGLTGIQYIMPPEMVNKQPYTNKVDVWALGVTLYYLFYDTFPSDYEYGNDSKIAEKIINTEPKFPNINGLTPEKQQQINQLLKDMLNNDPNHRLSANDVINRIQDIRFPPCKSFDIPELLQSLKMSDEICSFGRGFAQLSNSINQACFSLAKNATIHKINLNDFSILTTTISSNQQSPLCSVVLNPNGSRLIFTEFSTSNIYALDASSLRIDQIWNNTHNYVIKRAIFLDNNHFCVSYDDAVVKKFKLGFNDPVSVTTIENSFISAFHMDYNSTQLYAGNNNGELLSINQTNFSVTWEKKCHDACINFIAKYSNVVATGSDDGKVVLIDANTQARIQNIDVKSKIYQVDFMPGGRSLIVMAEDVLLLYLQHSSEFSIRDEKSSQKFFKGNRLRSFTQLNDKSILVGTSNGYIYRVKINIQISVKECGQDAKI